MPLGTAIAIGGKLLGSFLDKRHADKQAKQERVRQEEFAKQGIRWRVEDAKAAGIHPLAALGAPLHQPSPITVGTDFAGVGQDIGRAMGAMRTPSEKVDAYTKTVQDLTLQRMGLENTLLASQIRRAEGPGTGPGLPGGGNTPVDIAGNPMLRQSAAFGKKLKGNPNFSDAEIFEQRYGDSEVHQTGVAVMNTLADLYHTLLPPWVRNFDLGEYVRNPGRR